MAQQSQSDHPGTQAKADLNETGQAKAKAEMTTGIETALATIDTTIRTSLALAGPPGSGLFQLLNNIAVQLMGMPRSTYPVATASDPGSNSTLGQGPMPGTPPSSPPGPLPGQGRGQAPTAASSQPGQQ